MKKVWQIISFILILVFLTGLGVYVFTPRAQLLHYFAPQINFVRISNLLIKENQASLQLHLQATSPLLPVYINNLRYNFKLYDQSISRGQQTLTTKQNKKTQPITLPLRLNYLQTLPFVQRQLSNNLPVTARFTLLCQIPLLGNETIVLQQTLPFTIPVLVAPEITQVATEEIGFQHLRVILTLQVINENKFDYYLRDMSVKAEFPGYQAVATTIREDYLIKANQVTPIKIFSVKTLTKADKNLIFQANRSLNYRLKTAMVLEPVQVPIDKISFNASSTGSLTVPQEI